MGMSHLIDLISEIATPTFSTLTPVILGYLIKSQKKVDETTKEISNKIDDLKHNDLIILKARLRTETNRIIEKKSITYQELSSLESLYEVYEKMGGNGIVKHNMEKIRELKVKDE